jgi:type VI secretion system secreted protein VgrG
MVPNFVGKSRMLVVETPVGADKFKLLGFTGTESVSQLFQFELDLLSEEPAADYKQIVGKPITWGIQLPAEGEYRYFNGIVSRFTQLPSVARISRYRATVAPWLWLLSRTSDCKIFQDQSITDTIEAVLKEFSAGAFETNFTASYPKLAYCVQYRETALNFIMRLMEFAGIHFFFRHENGKHVLVLGDSPSANPACAQSTVRFERTEGSGFNRGEDTVLAFNLTREFRSGRCALNDWNFTEPATSLLSNTESQIDLNQNKSFELYDYPGGFEKRTEGDTLTRLRMEEQETTHVTGAGDANCRAFAAGTRFTLEEHDCEAANQEYLLTGVTHEAEQAGFYSGTELGEDRYGNRFTVIPASVPYRPARVTPKPFIRGCQTAVVTGPSSEYIHTDKYGRVKVQFHWDRDGRGDDNSSCWIRVSQPWAGNTWGAINIPRVGQEVVVSFLEGDPDRPLITGRVYNATEMPPYTLPDKNTITTFKTNTKDGGGFNELRFEDAPGAEQMFIHAQKNMDTRVLNDAFETVLNNKHTVVEKDRFIHVKNNRHKTVDQDEKIEIGKDHHLKVTGKQAVEVAQSRSVTVSGAVAEDFQQGYSTKVAIGYLLKAGTTAIIQADAGITLKCGGNSVVIDPSGVTIKGSLVTIEGQLVKINSGPGSPAGSGSPGNAVSPSGPDPAEDADQADPGRMDELRKEQLERKTGKYGKPQDVPFKPAPPPRYALSASPAVAVAAPLLQEPAPPPTHYIEIKLLDMNGNPVPGERYRVTVPDGRVAEGTLDENGYARVEGFDPGQCRIEFPDMDETVTSE